MGLAGVPGAYTPAPLKAVLGEAGQASQLLFSLVFCVCFGFCVLINPLGRDGIVVVLLSLADLEQGCAEWQGR